MLIHALPNPIRGNPFVQVTSRRDIPDSGMVLHYRFGSMDGDTFVPDPLMVEVKRTLSVHRANGVRGKAKAKGRPVTAGAQEHQWSDLLEYMDEEGLWEG